jgi:tetratricopeptide (TPR) repeat protein
LNQALRTGKKFTVDPPAVVQEKFGKFGGWVDLLRADGPFDDPSFCYSLGETFAGGEDYREGTPLSGGLANYLQAIQQFQRVLALAPDCSNASYWLCKIYLHIKKYPEALEAANHVLEMKPEDTSALFYQAVAQMQLGSYDKALQPLNHILAKNGENRYALLERAISQLQLHNYDAAKSDYEKLAKAFPKAYQVYYGLQEVAYQQKDTNAVIKNIELYLTNYYQAFPTNVTPVETDELKAVKQRLKDFKNGAP